MHTQQKPSSPPKQRGLHRRPMVFDDFSPAEPAPKSKSTERTSLGTRQIPEPLRAKDVLCGIGMGASGWILASTPLLFSVNPLALALLCATPRYMLWTLCGTLLACTQAPSNAALYVSAYVLATLLRALAHLLPSNEAQAPVSLASRLSTNAGQAWERLQAFGRYWRKTSLQAGQDTDGAPPLLLHTWHTQEPVSLRVAIALISALIPGIGVPIQGSFAFYDLYGAVFYLVLLPIATVAFAYGLEAICLPKSKDTLTVAQAIGLAALFASVCFCAREASLFGLSPAICLTVVTALFATRRKGLLWGAAITVLGGLVFDVRSIPLYLALTAVDALLYPLVSNFSLLPALLAALVYSLLRGGSTMFWALAPSVVVSVLCFSSLSRLLRRYRERVVPQSPAAPHEQNELMHRLLCEQNRNETLLRRISDVSAAFGNLSEVFRQLNDSLGMPGLHDVRRLCDEVLDQHCPSCPSKQICWGQDYEGTLASVLALCRTVAAQGTDAKLKLHGALDSRCPDKQLLIDELRARVCAHLAEQLGRAGHNSLPQSYDDISHLLRDVAHESGNGEADFCYDAPTSDVLMRYFLEHDIHPHHVCVTGKRQRCIQIFGISPAAVTLPQEQLRDELGALCHARLSPPRYEGSEEGKLTLRALPYLRADYVHRCSCAIDDSPPAKDTATPKGTRPPLGKRGVCGDTLRVFEGKDGMFYALLCDGMGSGKSAAMTSGSCAIFLEQTLRAGISVQTALRMLNHYLRSRSGQDDEECSSTVDLFILDLYTGKARFIKSGAAPSFLLRGGRLYRISSHSIPIGILQAIDAQVIPFDIQPGDHILLMSDGITDTAPFPEAESTFDGIDTQEVGDWITEFLSDDANFKRHCTDTPADPLKQTAIDQPYTVQVEQWDDAALLDTLFSMARQKGSLDDMSVISIRIGSEEPSTLSAT